MTKRLVLCLMLAGSLAGCRTLGTRPDPQACPEPGPAPEAPFIQPLPPGAELPEGATHVVVGLCQETGAYLGAGVDTRGRRFTYVVKGDRTTRELFFARVYRTGVPVVLFTSPVKAQGGSSTALTSGATATTGTTSGDEEPPYDPCGEVGTEIGDKPPPDPDDTGGANPQPPKSFTSLAWRSAQAVDGVSDPAASQVPPRTDVPR